MNAEKYLCEHFMPDNAVLKTLGSIWNKCGGGGYESFALVDAFNLGVMIGVRKERMARQGVLDRVMKANKKGRKAFKISNDALASIGIEKGDIVVCHCGVVPFVPLSDIVVYKKRDGTLRLAPYYGCYAKSQWAVWPAKIRRDIDFIGEDCVGVVSHIFSAKGSLKYHNDTRAYPKEFNLEQTIAKEPPNVGSIPHSNLTSIYDVL